MKHPLFFILFIVTNTVYSQTIVGTIKDSLTQNSIPFSNIVLLNGGGLYADNFGKFEIDIKNSIYDTLQISAIGYIPKKIPLLQFKAVKKTEINISLEPYIEELNEVIINSKKKYTEKVSLGDDRNGNIGMTSLIGYETCVFFENPMKREGKVQRIFIDLKGRKNADYTATLNIKFYAYDKKNNMPGKELYTKNIYVTPKNKKYRLWINVENYNIYFPEDGICLGVEMVNTIGEVKKYAYFGPMFRYTLSEDNKSKTWSNYHNKGWQGGAANHPKYKNFKSGISNPMWGLDALFTKN